MLAKVCQSLPQADRWVFIALEEDEKKYPIKPLAEMNLDGRVDVISVPEVIGPFTSWLRKLLRTTTKS